MPGEQKPHWMAVPCPGCDWLAKATMRGSSVAQAFDREDVRAIGAGRKRHAREHRPAVHDDRAGTAGALVAGHLHAGQAKNITQHIGERGVGGEVLADDELALATIDRQVEYRGDRLDPVTSEDAGPAALEYTDTPSSAASTNAVGGLSIGMSEG